MSYPLSIARIIQNNLSKSEALCNISLHVEEFLVPRQAPKVKVQHLSTVFHCAFSTFAGVLSYMEAVFMCSVGVNLAVVTGTYLTWETFTVLVKN